MGVPYDEFTGAFLGKIRAYNFPAEKHLRNEMVDGYMKRAISEFHHICEYDFANTADDIIREFDVDIPDTVTLCEIVDIISEGMVVHWLKPYVYHQENLENALNTRDFTTYSPAELLRRVGDTYNTTRRIFTNMMREYSYNHGDLTDLHL